MSTGSKGGAPVGMLPAVEDMKVAIVAAEWNGHITSALTEGALEVFRSVGLEEGEDVKVFHVPGAVEPTFAASQLIESGDFDAVIVFGSARFAGGTPHFDYVCQSVTQGVTSLNVDCDTPVIFARAYRRYRAGRPRPCRRLARQQGHRGRRGRHQDGRFQAQGPGPFRRLRLLLTLCSVVNSFRIIVR